MDPFHRLAAFTVARDTGFVALAASTLMLGLSFNLPLALFVGANIALAYALFLSLRAWRLTEQRVARSEPWRVLPRDERPAGEAGRKVARGILGDLWLRAASNAAAVAIVLSTLSLIVGSNGSEVGPVVAEQAGMAGLVR